MVACLNVQIIRNTLNVISSSLSYLFNALKICVRFSSVVLQFFLLRLVFYPVSFHFLEGRDTRWLPSHMGQYLLYFRSKHIDSYKMPHSLSRDCPWFTYHVFPCTVLHNSLQKLLRSIPTCFFSSNI